MEDLVHTGFYHNRISQPHNKLERALAEQWLKENDGTVNGSASNVAVSLIPDCTQRDASVAATIIQWIGSPVGQSFIDDAYDRLSVEQ